MDQPKRILLIQLKRAGDVIVTTPIASALHRLFPEAQIDFLVDKPFAPLLAHNPDLHQVVVYDRKAVLKTWQTLRAASYDVIFDFQSSPRSILAGLLSGARVRAGYKVTFWGRFLTHAMKRPGGGISVTEGKMNLVRTLFPEVPPAGDRRIYITPEERDWWAVHKMLKGGKHPIGIVPTHRRESRRWVADSFGTLAGLLTGQGMPVWLFWGPGEKEYVEAIWRRAPQSEMIPKTSLREMAVLFEQCRLVITNDNGPMHLAVAAGVPTLTIYGPTHPVAWNPGGPRHRVMQAKNLPCLGCNMNACPFGHECMTGIKAVDVFAESHDMLAQV